MMVLNRQWQEMLIKHIRDVGALEFGDFMLKSGARSRFYIDMRKFTLSSHIRQVAYNFRTVTDGFADIDAVGGPTVGADPIVGSLLFGWGDRLQRGFLVRSEAKNHGKEGLVIGSVQPGDRCLIVEDVVTTGGSLIHAIDAVEAIGAKVTHAACILDCRGEIGQKLAARGIDFGSLLTLADLGLESETEP